MSEAELIEALADKEHASWARWMDYLFSRCVVNFDGSLTIAADHVEGLRRQMALPYDVLDAHEKSYDREEVATILPIIHAYCRTGKK